MNLNLILNLANKTNYLLGIQEVVRTVASKLAKFLTRQGYKVGVIGADTYRPTLFN